MRYVGFWMKRYPELLGEQAGPDLPTWEEELFHHIYSLKDMPSMRAMMTAGEALERDNVAGFNCAYQAMWRQRAFDELMYILMCGTGVGFSCEAHYTKQLPTVSEEMYETDTTIVVADSKVGWASSFRELISLLYAGKVPKWDLSKVRPEGAPLKTFGGRASGPGPLDELFKYSISVFSGAVGRKLHPLEVHGLVCKIAEIVVVGGVRRSALISLSDLNDDSMRLAKSFRTVKSFNLLEKNSKIENEGSDYETHYDKYSVTYIDIAGIEVSRIFDISQWDIADLSAHKLAWYYPNPEFALANNSIAYKEKPNAETFLREWLALVVSKSGERGIFNSQASALQASKNGRRDANHEFGTNPCSEIILRDRQFCNLSENVVRAGDTFDSLERKVRIATILGTLQATLVDFRYLGKKWRDNTAEERLLGVSLTGIMDNAVMSNPYLSVGTDEIKDFLGERKDVAHSLDAILEALKGVAIETNIEWAEKLGIEPSAAITCVKPSGTVSQLVDSASGIHPRHAPYYIRTVRADKKDPLARYMVDAGFPVEDDVMKPNQGYVFSFPMKAPEGAVFRNDRSAIEQLELWLIYQRHWCEHKPSITVYVKDEEWMEVGSWVYDHFDEISGVSFLPHSDHSYKQAPYQEITEEEYNEWIKKMPKDIVWSDLRDYESSDHTEAAQLLACTGSVCEL
jgi:adenosylcobalamin-dependent ribonucleoside-triphosphate reductase